MCTAGVFSTTTMSSPCTPLKPSSAIVDVASASKRALNAGSDQARATTLAPLCGPILVSYVSTIAASAAGCTKPFSTNKLSIARTRSATSLSCVFSTAFSYFIDFQSTPRSKAPAAR